MKIKAILWDVGGPIINEEMMNPQWEAALIQSSSEVLHRQVSQAEYDAANRAAIDSFAPYVWRAIMWKLVKQDLELFEKGYARFKKIIPDYSTEFQPNMVEFLLEISKKIPMAVVSNQSGNLPKLFEELMQTKAFQFFSGGDSPSQLAGGIGGLLSPALAGEKERGAWSSMQGGQKLQKPDTRLFQLVLDKFQIQAHEALMVGDRIDNDVVPAKMVGLKTLLIKTGWHRTQEPRLATEIPDWTVNSIPEMQEVIKTLLSE